MTVPIAGEATSRPSQINEDDRLIMLEQASLSDAGVTFTEGDIYREWPIETRSETQNKRTERDECLFCVRFHAERR